MELAERGSAEVVVRHYNVSKQTVLLYFIFFGYLTPQDFEVRLKKQEGMKSLKLLFNI